MAADTAAAGDMQHTVHWGMHQHCMQARHTELLHRQQAEQLGK